MSTKALNLPMTYVNIESEEMEYIDGGINASWVATALDIPIMASGLGFAFAPVKYLGKQAVLKFVKANASTIVKFVVGVIGSAAANFTTTQLINAITNVAGNGLSLGGIIATGLDMADGNLNGDISF